MLKQKANLFLWKLSLYKPCPYCGGKILEEGHPNFLLQCANKSCKFNKERSFGDKITVFIPDIINNILLIFVLFLMFLLLVFLYIATIPHRIHSWVLN